VGFCEDSIDAARISVEDATSVATIFVPAGSQRSPHTEEAIVSNLEKTSWKTIEVEKMNDLLSRQMISGKNATISQLIMKRGATVPRHSHVNEQYSWILSGSVKFIFDDREILLGPGDVLLIPAHEPHSAVALEDTVDVDFFAPRREDWIQKDDSYLRG
jgi:quercetin dioxygenase-like cupin family protein